MPLSSEHVLENAEQLRKFGFICDKIDLVQSGTLAQLHDLDTEVPHGLGGAGVLHTLAPVAGLLHIGLTFHLACSDAADHDVDMDVSRMVVPIRVSADDGRMTGEVFFAEFQGSRRAYCPKEGGSFCADLL